MSKVTRNQKCLPATGRRWLKASTMLTILLAALLTTLVIILGQRLNTTWEMSINQVTQVSQRTRDMLADTQGTIRITCFMDRRHPMFRPLSRLLRGLRQCARSVAGAEINIVYIDPRWDLTRAGQLAAQGVPENSLLFEHQRRKLIATLDEMIHQHSPMLSNQPLQSGSRQRLGVFRGESVCAAVIARLALPSERTTIYWLQGHGELSHDDPNDLYGYSDITREIRRNGFELKPLTLSGLTTMPSDCQTIVVAGPRYDLQPDELLLLDNYLQNGGALLYLAAAHSLADLDALLAKWGIELLPYRAASTKILSGGEVVISHFSDHPIVRSLRNTSLVLGIARCLAPVANPTPHDSERVTLLAESGQEGWGTPLNTTSPRRFDPAQDLAGPVAVAAAAERGGSVAREVAFRPTRLCVIGSTDFITNGALTTRANANRDFFLNAVAWLTGVELGSGSSLGGDATLATGFSRTQWVTLMGSAIAGVPTATLLLFIIVYLRKKR